MGIASLVLGIVAFVLAITFILAPLGAILAVVGLILGIVDTVKKGKTGEKKVISITGLILSAVMFVVLIVESIAILGVGILVYDTAKDYDRNRVIETVQEKAVEAFNSSYTSYRGSQTGVRVRTLLNIVQSNNRYSEHEIAVYYNGTQEIPDRLKEKILSGEQYNIHFYEDLDGYINRVYIMPEYTGKNNELTQNNVISNKQNTGNKQNSQSMNKNSI